MEFLKIGLIREGKVPYDRRVALTPVQCALLMEKYKGLSIFVQPSDSRAYSNQEFEEANVVLKEDIDGCDILFGIKEVPIQSLLSEKTYFFFSHTLKKQPYNKDLLIEILRKKITLIDYEAITDQNGERLVAFGRFAGIVGAYNTFRTIGVKYNIVKLPPCYTLFDKKEMISALKGVDFPPLKMVVTGSGRVAKGVKEVFDGIGIRQVSIEEFINSEFDTMTYVMPKSSDYYLNDEKSFDKEQFYKSPWLYKSTFIKFARSADVLVASAYWNPMAPPLFTKEEASNEEFKIKVIADITCDINGSIPTTVRSSTIYSPFYDYNVKNGKVEEPFSGFDNITVMAIDNLPSELPRDASEFFGEQLITYVFPGLMGKKGETILENSIIAKDGLLTKKFEYLRDFVEG